MKTTTLLATALLLLLIGSCTFNGVKGEGEVVTQQIDLDLIDALKIESSTDVMLYYGPNQKIEVRGQQNIIDLLSREVNGDRWVIDFDGSVMYDRSFEIHVTLPSISSIEIDGSGDITGQTPFKGKDLELIINGSGDIEMEINHEEVNSTIDGSGNITLSGFAEEHTIYSDGSGNIEAEDLRSKVVTAEVRGSGDVTVTATESIEVSSNGSGNVYYYGNPGSVEMDKSGSGSVISKD